MYVCIFELVKSTMNNGDINNKIEYREKKTYNLQLN